jgi:hypothetical protein
MSSWGKNDNAANAPYWAVNSAILNALDAKTVAAAPDAANVALLYGNTTSGVYTTGETIGLFLVDGNEQDVQEAAGTPPAHVGWNIKTTGSGGRAGRVQWETLVALSQVSSDNNSDDAVLPDAKIVITSQPTALSGPVSQATADTITLTVGAEITDGALNAALSYQWQVNNNTGGSWVDVPNGTGVTTGQPGNMTKTGANTATLVLDPTGTTANNYVFRAKVFNSDTGATEYSANARILITT